MSITPLRRHAGHSPYTRTTILEFIEASGRRKGWVARQMGISASYLTLVGQGQRRITPEFAAAACRVLQVPPSAIFHQDLAREKAREEGSA